MEKIKVSREVADAIEELDSNFNQIMKIHSSFEKWGNGAKQVLNSLTTKELATALIVGYEVEMTPHQKIAKEYADAEQERLAGLDLEDTCLIYQNLGIEMGIEFTLNALGVVVEGVNDNEN